MYGDLGFMLLIFVNDSERFAVACFTFLFGELLPAVDCAILISLFGLTGVVLDCGASTRPGINNSFR